MVSDASEVVRAQYEEHPYPYWQVLPDGDPVTDEKRYVLYAGCGTGLDILTHARAAPQSQFLGIDLSERSLAHAQQKAREYGIKNVQLRRHDILDVASIGDTFDFVKSTGVLHHMKDPLAGLLALKSVLRADGEIKFSVYSRLARRHTLAAIELRKELNVPPTEEGIRGFRDLIRNLPDDHPAKRVIESPDFYSVAGTRDLLFHVLEHNFTIPTLVEMVDKAGLEIVRWGPQRALQKYAAMGYSDPSDWKQLHEAEQKRPALFANSMYTLFVRPRRSPPWPE